jgi:hypothetical protein
MQDTSWIVWGAIWAYTCYKMAHNRGRSELLGALLGFVFGLFAVAGYAIAGHKRSEDEQPSK